MTARPAASPLLDDPRRAANDDLNRWRGRCVHLFAQIEEALGETINLLIAVGQDPAIKRQALFGQRFDTVCAAFADGRPYAKAGKQVLTALEHLAPQIDLRNIVVHATGNVLLDCRGNWTWHYRFVPSGKAAKVTEAYLPKDEAEQHEKALAAGGRSLRDRLGNLRASIKDYGDSALN